MKAYKHELANRHFRFNGSALHLFSYRLRTTDLHERIIFRCCLLFVLGGLGKAARW
uniref:Uncharacterized protein n=1 Tax=mine drainage metagenome TaxID=410659 RepID=E6QH74_9ZZZZ